jgi:hypothetical protein
MLTIRTTKASVSSAAGPSSRRRVALVDTLFELRRQIQKEGHERFDRWRPMLKRLAFRPGALNMAHYLALRKRDMRPVQEALTPRCVWCAVNSNPPYTPRTTATPSVSSRRCSASGPTSGPTTRQTSAPPLSPPGSSGTTANGPRLTSTPQPRGEILRHQVVLPTPGLKCSFALPICAGQRGVEAAVQYFSYLRASSAASLSSFSTNEA